MGISKELKKAVVELVMEKRPALPPEPEKLTDAWWEYQDEMRDMNEITHCALVKDGDELLKKLQAVGAEEYTLELVKTAINRVSHDGGFHSVFGWFDYKGRYCETPEWANQAKAFREHLVRYKFHSPRYSY